MTQGNPAIEERSAAAVLTQGGARTGLWLPMATLWQREVVRFFRQRNRVISSLVTPLIFWALLGSGLNSHTVGAAGGGGDLAGIAAGDVQAVGYREFFFPGIVLLMVLNTAVFSTITVIEDRREGFLQAVMVSPSSRLAIVMGKVLGGASVAFLQGLVMLALWPFVSGDLPSPGWLAASAGLLFVIAVGLTALGLCVAWPMDSTAGFHAVMMVFLLPMWFLSGAVFPWNEATPRWLAAVMAVNPLTYGQAAFSQAMSGGAAPLSAPVPLPWSAGVAVASVAATVTLAWRVVSRRRKDGSG